MGLISKMSEAVKEAAAQKAAERQALQERMKPYYRGYDVYPQEVCEHFAGMVRGSLARTFAIMTVLFGGSVGAAVIFFVKEIYAGFMLSLVPAVIFLLLALWALSPLTRMLGGDYDAFGAMITDTRVEEHRSTDSEGRSTTTYTYYVWLNGIQCQVSGGEFRKVKTGDYCYFVRLRAKYIKDDQFYFFPSDPAEQDHRISQHYPVDELRLQGPPPGSGWAVLLIVLGILGVIGSIVMWVTHDEDPNGFSPWIPAVLGSAGAAVLGIILRKITSAIRARKMIEEKKRIRESL